LTLAAAWLIWAITAEVVWYNGGGSLQLVIADFLPGLAWTVAGLVVWKRIPGNHFGPLMVATGFTWFIGTYAHGEDGGFGYASSELVNIAAFLLEATPVWIMIWLTFAYPSGRIERPSERWALGVIIAYSAIVHVGEGLAGAWIFDCAECTPNPLALTDNDTAYRLFRDAERVLEPVMAILIFGLLARRFLITPLAMRRLLAPLWTAAMLIAVFYVARGSIEPSLPETVYYGLTWVKSIAHSLIPLVFLGGLLQVRFLIGPLGRLMSDLDALPESGALETAMARALGDPTVKILYLMEDRDEYTDSLGAPAQPPAPGGDRATTVLAHRGVRLGLLVHDLALQGQPELVASVCSAAGMAVANERLRAEVRRQLSEVEAARAREIEALRESRSRIVAAQEGIRREIASHLHGPVQGRLLGLHAQLDSLAGSEQLAPEEAARLKAIAQDLRRVIQEDISLLSRRLYPAIVRRGVVPSLQSLSDRFETTLDIRLGFDERLTSEERLNPSLVSEQTRLAAYRITEEALTNVLKHAGAGSVEIDAAIMDNKLALSIRDDGKGYILDERPLGLGVTSMLDYAEAVGGICDIKSAPGAGTCVSAVLPVIPRPVLSEGSLAG
jgi:signal transduction histidine kinase